MPEDFSGKDLRGRSFKGQDLTGADFSYADIRGANFTNATLRSTNFSNAKAGLQRHWATALVMGSLLFSGLSGLLSGYAGYFTALAFNSSDPVRVSMGVVALIALAASFIVTIRQGLGASLGAFAFALVIAIAVTIAGVVAIAFAVANTGAVTAFGAVIGTSAVTVAVTVTVAVAGAVAVVVAGSGVVVVAFTVAIAFAFAVAGAVAVVFASAMTLLSAYIGWRTLAGDEKYAFVRGIAIAFAAIGGTSFGGADLTDADFTQATLKSTDLRNANLRRTNLHKTKNLERARVSGTILLDPKVRELVVTHRGTHKSYISCNFKGANLAGAELNYADLTEADVSEATFEGAWLEQANLTKTQASKTNFKQARLTGACLEAWNIDSDTQLEGAICDYVYLKNNQQERRPSSGEFVPGEFTKLFQEVLHTVDLIFRNGIDWKTFTYSFHQLQVENEGTELSIRSIENKGDGVVVVRVDVPADADKSKMHAEFTQNYEQALKALEGKYRDVLTSKDEQIDFYRQQQESLTEILRQIVSRPDNILPERRTVKENLVVLKLGKGDFHTGFPVTLQIWTEGSFPSVECTGELASAPQILQGYNQWQSTYRRNIRAFSRLSLPATQVTNVSRTEFFEEYHEAAQNLKKQLNLWLNSQQFCPVKERMLEKLTPTEPIRIVVQTENSKLRRLPWNLWDFCERYSQAEIAVSTSAYERIEKSLSPKATVRILAILGNSLGIDVQKDRAMLEQLPDAEVTFLVEPQRRELNDKLWDQPWDILFFAGHSSSQADGETGQIYINQTDRLTVSQLKHPLRQAIARGLRLAIFNSCDGLGLAFELADVHIPQIIVMREPVPDRVAQEFLKNFLTAFSSGKPLYQSVREAREKLQWLEEQFPCATWLPVICQNLAEAPLTWQELRGD